MNWRLVLLWSLSIVVMTVPLLLGWLRSEALAFVIFLLLAQACAWHLGRVTSRPFLNGFWAGLLMGLWQHLILFVLWDLYAANNAQAVSEMRQSAPGIEPRLLLLIGMVVCAVFYGLITGFFSWCTARFVFNKNKRSKAVPAAAPEH